VTGFVTSSLSSGALALGEAISPIEINAMKELDGARGSAAVVIFGNIMKAGA